MTRILIIDDEEMIRASLREVLELGGFEVLEAADGQQGLQLLQTDPANVVITDIFMPEKEGIETILELHRSYPEIRIIAMSGGGHQVTMDILETAKKLAPVRTLRKPFSPDELLGMVREVLTPGPRASEDSPASSRPSTSARRRREGACSTSYADSRAEPERQRKG